MTGEPRKVAVALEYDQASHPAPRVTAKGRGTLADQIVAAAQEHGVIIDTNPQLAEALSQVELDDEIPIELYQAVAEVIGYVMRVSGTAGGR